MSAVNTGKLAIAGGIAIIAGVSFIDRSVNYVPVKASITSAKVDCYVEGKKGRVVHKDTNDTAYMACDMAPLAAAQFGYDKDHVRKRAVVGFSYTSPVDGSRQSGQYTDLTAGRDYKPGTTVEIYAHTSEAEKSRWN